MEIYVRRVQLEQILASSRLQLVETSGLAALMPADVTLRFNNRDHVLTERILELITFAATAGAALVVLACGLVGVSIGERKQCQGGPEAGT